MRGRWKEAQRCSGRQFLHSSGNKSVSGRINQPAKEDPTKQHNAVKYYLPLVPSEGIAEPRTGRPTAPLRLYPTGRPARTKNFRWIGSPRLPCPPVEAAGVCTPCVVGRHSCRRDPQGSSQSVSVDIEGGSVGRGVLQFVRTRHDQQWRTCCNQDRSKRDTPLCPEGTLPTGA